MGEPSVTLDQWHIFRTVVEQGSFQGAADHLLKSQSSISYAIRNLQDSLGVRLFEVQGRRAMLTHVGNKMLGHASELLRQAANVEQMADEFGAGWEPLVRVMTTQVYSPGMLVGALEKFTQTCPVTSIDFQRGTLSGVTDAATFGTADIVVSSRVPVGLAGEKLHKVQMARVAHRGHPLTLAEHPLTTGDLKKHTQIVIGDTGTRRSVDAGWLGSDQRWTVESIEESLGIVRCGLAHGNLPVDRIEELLASGELVELPVEGRQRFELQIYLVLANKQTLGPAGLLLVELLKDQSRGHLKL